MAGTSQQAADPIIAALKQRMVTRATPRLAHELNNELTIISGQAELAQRQGGERLHQRMEQIKFAARSAQKRNLLMQQLDRDDGDTAAWTMGAAIAEDVEQLAALLTARNLEIAVSVTDVLPTVDRTRLRWITGAVILAASPNGAIHGSHVSLALGAGRDGLRLACHARGVDLAEWLAPTLAHCATAADVYPTDDGWQALVILAEVI